MAAIVKQTPRRIRQRQKFPLILKTVTPDLVLKSRRRVIRAGSGRCIRPNSNGFSFFIRVGYTYANLGELLETYDRLKQLGITPVHHGLTLSVYYQDPDGNRMEVQVDCCAHADEAHAFLQSDAFAANPIGVDFDPDALLTQNRNGVPPEMLLVQPEGQASSIPPEHGIS